MSLLHDSLLTDGTGVLPAAPIDVDGHTMAPDRLLRYLQIKAHHLIQERHWNTIRVDGGYDRRP